MPAEGSIVRALLCSYIKYNQKLIKCIKSNNDLPLPQIDTHFSHGLVRWKKGWLSFKMLGKFKKSMQTITLVFLLMLGQIAYTVTNQELPQLIKRTYHGVASRIINVTVGEQFSLPLPLFDSLWNSHNFQAYQLNEQQFNRPLSPPQPSEETPQSSQQQSTPTQIQMDYLPFDCQIGEGSTRIVQVLESVRQEYTHALSNNWQENTYVLLPSKSILYILNTGSSEIVAYIYNERKLEKLTSYKMTQLAQREEEEGGDLTLSPPTMALNSREDKLYIFTSKGIWGVDTKTVLATVKKIDNLSGFDSANYGGIDKVVHGEMGVIVAVKRLDRVFVISQLGSDAGQSFIEISSYDGTKIFPQDAAILSNNLFVLDFYNGVYVYSLLKGEVKPRGYIALTSFGGNFQFRVLRDTIFINFNDIDGSKVVQISMNEGSDTYELVRFYKSQQFITKLKVFMVPTQYYLQPHEDKYNEDSLENYLFLIQNSDDLEIYPYNLDPRIINEAYNALKLKTTEIKELFHIGADRFIIVTNEQIQYLRIAINKPAVVCTTKRMPNLAPENYYLLKLSNNVSSCEHKDHSQPLKRRFNQYCEMQISYYLHIGDPDQSQHQKVMLYGTVLGVVVAFVGGLLCLMQWRNNKMMILGRLKNEILHFRDRHRKIQPFVEENYEQKEVEIEVPKVEAVLQSQ